jgi:hypothetical protein
VTLNYDTNPHLPFKTNEVGICPTEDYYSKKLKEMYPCFEQLFNSRCSKYLKNHNFEKTITGVFQSKNHNLKLVAQGGGYDSRL